MTIALKPSEAVLPQPVAVEGGVSESKVSAYLAEIQREQVELRTQFSILASLFEDLRGNLTASYDDQKRLQGQDEIIKKGLAFINERMDSLEQVKKAQEADAKAAEEARLRMIKRLGKTYAGLPPEKAADILKELDDNAVTILFANMKDAEIALILPHMPPKRAASVTAMLGDFRRRPT
jgi:flagellar motility protein MotE (MotC chaperone)